MQEAESPSPQVRKALEDMYYGTRTLKSQIRLQAGDTMYERTFSLRLVAHHSNMRIEQSAKEPSASFLFSLNACHDKRPSRIGQAVEIPRSSAATPPSNKYTFSEPWRGPWLSYSVPSQVVCKAKHRPLLHATRHLLRAYRSHDRGWDTSVKGAWSSLDAWCYR